MNILVEQKFIGLDKNLKMTSVEVAELTDKHHYNVLRKIRELAAKGIIRGLPQIEEKHEGTNRGRPTKLCRLNRTESINLVANLCPLFTQKIIDRWQELEQRLVEPNYDQLQELSVDMKVFERIGKIGSELMNERKRLLSGCQLCLGFGE